MTAQLRFRPATIDDAPRLFTWRNDPVTRENSLNTEEVPWERHVAWLTRTVGDEVPGRRLYVAEDAGTPIGTIRTDKDTAGYTEISYTVAPERRGQGLGTAMVVQFAQEYLRGEKIKAQIKKGVVPSERLARALGLSPVAESPSGDPRDLRPIVEWRYVAAGRTSAGAE